MPTVKTANLGALLLPWVEAQDSRWASLTISGLQNDSRKVVQGDLFVAVRGHQSDGNQFIPQAIEAGATAILSHVEDALSHGIIEWIQGLPVIRFFELDRHLSAIAQRAYLLEQPQPALIGITGTNGKTTISQLIAQWLQLQNTPCGVMGTTGNGMLDNIKPALNTTGSPIEIQATLSDLQEQGAKAVALEVSSHGLVQHRVAAAEFKVGVFTNLSRDHLDYHGDMDAYADAKRLLFTQHKTQSAVINSDDPVGERWLREMPKAIAISTQPQLTSALASHRYICAEQVTLSNQGMSVSVVSSWGNGVLNTPLVGAFNVHNLLLALGVILELGYAFSELIATAPKLQAVIGRMEVFHRVDKPMLVVDYAHTPDALEKALHALQGHCEGNLWCIVGCGGDRDKGKRPMMAAIAEQYANNVVITDDNPRSESPEAIVADMVAGMKNPDRVIVQHDRALAIKHAFSQAQPSDIVLIAGKGHEDYQVFAAKTVHYSDRETAQALLEVTA